MFRRGLFVLSLIVLVGAFGCTTVGPSIVLSGLPAAIIHGGTYTLTLTGSPGSSTGLWTYTLSSSCGGTFTSTATPNNGPANPITIGFTNAPTVQVNFAVTNPTADLSVTKSDTPDPVGAGYELTYTLTVGNVGTCTVTAKLTTASGRQATTSQNAGVSAANVQLTDTLPNPVTFGSATPSQGTCTVSFPTVTCNLGTIANGGSVTVTIKVTPQAGAVPSITNTASVTGAITDSNAANDSDSEDTTVTPVADLSVAKSDNPDPVTYGQNVTYTVTVTNSGPSPATNVVLTDTLPASVTFVSVTPGAPTCTHSTGTVTCNWANFPVGNQTVTIVVKAQAAGIDLVVDDDAGTCAYTGTVTDTASVTATEFDPSTGNNNASADTTVNASYNTIQAAINAAPAGSTIFVCPGTYTEQLSIDKSLTLSGAGAATTTIKAPSAASRTTYTIPESTATWDPIVFARGTGAGVINVSISGFTIDGQNNYGSTSTRYVGVLYRNVKPGAISNNIVKDLGHDGTQTFGILVYGDSNVTISSNQVSNYGRGGIGANGDAGASPDPNAIIQGNTVTGPGATAPQTWASNGIQIAWGATGEIKNNEVTGNGWPGTDWTGTGIIVVDSSNVVVQGNNVHDNESGIIVGGYYGTVSGLQVKGNIVNNNEWGVQVINGASNTVVEDNTVTNQDYDGLDVWNYGWAWTSDPTGTEVHNNVIVGNGWDGAWTNVTVEVVDMESNWWGNANGPYDAADDAGETTEVPPCTNSPASEKNTTPMPLGDSVADTSTTAIDYCPWLNAAPFSVSIPIKPPSKPSVRSGNPSVAQPIE